MILLLAVQMLAEYSWLVWVVGLEGLRVPGVDRALVFLSDNRHHSTDWTPGECWEGFWHSMK